MIASKWARHRILTFLPRSHGLCFFDDSGEIDVNGVSDSKHEFHGGISLPVLNEAEHGLRHARALRHSIIGETASLPVLAQQADDFRNHCLVMGTFDHKRELQKIRLTS